jgi:hypothetical protein
VTRFEITTSPLERLTDGSRALLATFAPEQVTKVAAARVKRLLVNHLTLFHQQNPNQFGAPRSGIYADMARSVNVQEGRDSSVSITHTAILQKIFGGEIKPRTKRFLTLPAIAEAYGKPSRDFGVGLKVETIEMDALAERDGGVPEYIPQGLQSRPWAKALVEAERTELSSDFFKKSGRKKQIWEKARKRGGRVVYWLVRKVNQKATLGIIPHQAEIEAEILAGVDGMFQRQFGIGAQTIEGPFQPGGRN